MAYLGKGNIPATHPLGKPVIHLNTDLRQSMEKVRNENNAKHTTVGLAVKKALSENAPTAGGARQIANILEASKAVKSLLSRK